MRRLLILLVFLISGAAGLIYQVVWMRQLTLILGVTSQAVSTVLAVFMGGLALGSWVFGKRVDRAARPMRLYGQLELGIAVLGALSLVILRAMLATYGDLRAATGALFPLIRVVLACLAILAPTTLMGATLPVLIRGVCRSRERIARESGLFYGINTVGAVLGTLASAFFLVEHLGIRGTTLVAVGINLLAGALAFALAGREDELPVEESSTAPEPVSEAQARTARAVVFAFGVSGFLALSYEVLWTRYLIYVVSENSVFAFATMLAAFLIGIALGSLVASALVDRVSNRVGLLGGIFVLLGAAAATTVTLMGLLHGAGSGRMGGGETFWHQTAGQFLRSLGVLIVPTTLSGSTFAIVARIYARDISSLGSDAGRAYAINTLGAILGALAGGFLILPRLGLVNGLVLLALINVALGLWLLLRRQPGGRMLRTAGATSAVAVLAFLAIPLWAETPEQLLVENLWDSGSEILYYADGPESSVAVAKSPDGSLEILVDGEGQAGTNTRMQIHLRLLGHLPVIFHPDPKEVLVVAFGAGVTTGCALQHPIERLDQVELNPKVIHESSRFFEAENHDPVHDPRFHAIFDDGRNYLLATDKKYDVITSDPIDPNDRGTTSLYCKEYYELVAEHLNEGGLACQWITTGYGKQDYDMLLRSFQSSFDHTAVFFADFTTVVVGFKGEPRMTLADLRAKFELPKVRASLGRVGIESAEMLLALMLTGPDATREMIWSGDPERDVMNTDDRPRIEYYRTTGDSWVSGREWQALLKGRSPDHSDWLADWTPADQAACSEAYGWMDNHLTRTMGGLLNLPEPGEQPAAEAAEPEPASETPAERDAAYLAAAPEREGKSRFALDSIWSLVGDHVDRIMLLMSGLEADEPSQEANEAQRQLYTEGMALGLAAFSAGDNDLAHGHFERVAARVPGAYRAMLLSAGCLDRGGDSLGALEELLGHTDGKPLGWGSPFDYARPLLEQVFVQMDQAEPSAATALGQRLMALTPDELDCPAKPPSAPGWGPAAEEPESWPPPMRPAAEALGSADAWRLWWRDVEGYVRIGKGRFDWRSDD